MNLNLFKKSSYIIVLTILFGCSQTNNLSSKKVLKDDVNILHGEITREDLFFEFPEWKTVYDEYEPDKNIVDSLSYNNIDLEVEVFLGTWCADSKREVPRFFKIVDQNKFVSENNIRLWAVDRKKKLDSGLTENKDIKRVATFIFRAGGNEIGRIIERPKSECLEKDILMILQDYFKTYNRL